MTLRDVHAAWFRWLALLLLASLTSSCTWSAAYWANRLYGPAEYGSVNSHSRFAKVHLRDGSVVVLENWSVSRWDRRVSGLGRKYNAERMPVGEARVHYGLPFDEIVMIEATQPQELDGSGLVVLGIALGATAATALVCLATTKVCFGSCPTVYAGGAAEGPVLAESFSSSIARSLEAHDVDPLPGVRADQGVVMLTVTNEALETHAIRSMALLAVEVPPGAEVLREGEAFYAVAGRQAPSRCRSSVSGDCLDAVRIFDDVEFHSPSHPRDLATRETLTLTLPAVDGPAGVELTVRNSLLNTFLFYQAWAWLGVRADDWLHKLDHAGAEGRTMFRKIDQALGALEVEVRGRDGRWLAVGRYDEIGPIAKEHVLMRLPAEAGEGPYELRIAGAQGNVRIDAVGVVRVLGALTPRVVAATEVRDLDGQPHEAATAALTAPDRHLVTYPGDAWVVRFLDAAATPQSRYLLDAAGYYIEWQQPGWAGQQDERRFVRFLQDPAAMLRELAPAFKRLEPSAEQMFWSSRFRRSRP